MTTVITIISVLIVANFGFIFYQNTQIPDLGMEDGKFKPLSNKPNNVSTQTQNLEKKVEPWPFKGTKEETMAAIKSAINSYGGAETQKENENYLYVVFTTKLMRYHDDAEFWLDDEDRLVHFRSASRAGYSDMGLNRKRYDQLTEVYMAQGK